MEQELDYWIHKNDGKSIPDADGMVGVCDVCSLHNQTEKEKFVVIGNNQWPDYDTTSLFICRGCITKIYNDPEWDKE